MHNGMVWKNDVNVHCGSKQDGISQRRRVCELCKKEIGDFETVLFCFLGRGTQFMTSAYVHKECEATHVALPIRKSSFCRICEGRENLDGCLPLRSGRKMAYHRSCLDNIPYEIVEKEKILKRSMGRTKRRVLQQNEAYSMLLDGIYDGLKFTQGDIQNYWVPSIKLQIRSLDGKLEVVAIYIEGWRYGYIIDKKFSDRTFSLDNLMALTIERASKEEQEKFKLAFTDLVKHYDTKGNVIGQRLDADQKIRFLLSTGTTMEALIEDSIEKAKEQYAALEKASEEEK